MPSYTTSLRLVQPATGEYSGTWGTQVNTGITALVDASIAGTTSITMTAANYTLTTANGASDESRAMFLVLGGTPGAAREVIVPAVSKLYFVTNSTTGGFAQTVKTASGSGISVPNGARMTLRCDGTDVAAAQNYFASMTLGAALPTASGGTGITSFGTGVATWLGTPSSANLAAAVTDETGSGALVFGTSPTLTTPILGAASATSITNGLGAAATPSYTFTGDTNTGIWSPAADTIAFSEGGVEAMRLDSSGNLGIGTSSPGVRLSVDSGATATNTNFNSTNANGVSVRFQNSGTSIGDLGSGATCFSGGTAGDFGLTSRAGNLAFGTGSTEHARITSGGDLLVGTATLAGAGGVSFQSQSGTGFAIINNNNAGATGYVFSSYRRSSVEIGSVTQNGTTAVLFNTTSDRRLKDNITPAPSASAVIDAIEIVSHDWKAAPDEHVAYGVIAQDLALVAPQAVLQGDDGEEVEKTWGVDYSKLVPMLIKEIQTLRARVAALEQA